MSRWSAILALVVLGCAPSPRTVPCENDGQCSQISSDYRYCLHAQCVECVGASECGPHNYCDSGRCVRTCKDGRQCHDDERCESGTCAKM